MSVAVDGRRLGSEVDLQKAGGVMGPGEVLRLTVVRGGRSEEVSLEAGPTVPQPTPEALESYLRQVVNE